MTAAIEKTDIPEFAFPAGRAAEDYGFGLTKREYFAAAAMQGLLAQSKGFTGSYEAFVASVTKVSVTFADALIQALADK